MLLTTPPLRIVACVVETGTPLVQLLAVDQSPVLPAFQLSNELMPMPTSSGKPAETSTTLPAESKIAAPFWLSAVTFRSVVESWALIV